MTSIKQPPLHPPLIITLQLDKEAQDYFNGLRREHFPAALNFLDAHLTLFHHLPSNNPAIPALLDQSSLRDPIKIDVTGLWHTGYGVAFLLHSNELTVIHQHLQMSFNPWLTPQDRNKLKPHVMVQNKVAPFLSRQLFATLQGAFSPFRVTATGFNTWIYRNGPWEHLLYYPFLAG